LRRALREALVLAAVLTVTACDLAYPQVVVVNKTGEAVLLRDVSFNGCSWPGVLAYGDATPVGDCLPGSDRVHFLKLDGTAYVQEQEEDAEPGVDEGLKTTEPLWFGYQTTTSLHAGYGDVLVFEVTLDDLEQDFSAPSPYGH
jgi:hypothetical protein